MQNNTRLFGQRLIHRVSQKITAVALVQQQATAVFFFGTPFSYDDCILHEIGLYLHDNLSTYTHRWYALKFLALQAAWWKITKGDIADRVMVAFAVLVKTKLKLVHLKKIDALSTTIEAQSPFFRIHYFYRSSHKKCRNLQLS